MNRPESLCRTIGYLEKSSNIPDEVIVVDQSQDRDVAERVRDTCRCTNLNVIYKWNDEPSLTKARNTGYSLAKGDIIVFMDDDVDVDVDTLENAKRLFADDSIAMVGGVSGSLKHDIKLSSVIFGRTSFHRRKKGHVTKAVYGRFPLCTEEYTESEWAMGFLFCVRKELMDRWEIRFDETLRYYAYAEDLDFSYRYYKCAHKENLRCLISSLLHVKHNVSTEYRTPARRHVFMHSVHRWYLSKKLFNSYISQLMVFWADMGYMAFRFIRKESVRDNWDAIKFCIRYRKDIINGNLHYLDYMQ